MDSNYSLSDIRAATNSGMNGQDNWFWIVVLFLFEQGGFGNKGALTRAEMNDGFNNQNVMRQLDGISDGLCSGFHSQNTTMLQGFNGLGNQIAENRFAAQNCCCETNRNIDSVRYDNQKNTCDITTAIHAEGEATRALINANTMQELRDRLEDRDRALLTANFQLSQQSQSAAIINELRPCAKPAYITCSPYQARGGCGCDYYA